MHFIAELRRRRRGQIRFLIITALPLLAGTVLFVQHLVWPGPADSPLDLQREWAVIPLLALPWLGWGLMAWLHRRAGARHPDAGRSINASVAALLEETRSEQARYRFIGGLLLACIIVLPLVAAQLRSVGKAGDEITVPFLVLFPAVLLAIVIGMAVHFHRKLRPRERELEALLADYGRQEPKTPMG
jgi:protein-S-isoprenylcysteine O-methyltransferase Ste14